jgi:hypothetical protein
MATVHVSGPIFDGRAQAALVDLQREIATDVAAQGYSNVMANLNASIKHPTPYYETQITVDDIPNGRRIHDRRVVYGPWLEGVGSRNAPVTRFRGYFSFRRAAAKLQGQAQAIAENTVARFKGRFG